MSRDARIRGALVLVVAAMAVFTVTLRAALYAPREGIQAAPALAQARPEFSSPEDLPARIAIPALDIDAPVEHVGRLPGTGRMAAPRRVSEVAWYRDGTVPGYPGSAIIAGHLDDGLGLPAVFRHLADLEPGDTIEVLTQGGARITFVVLNLSSYLYDQVPASIFADESGVYLNLVTCAGRWIRARGIGGTYDRRLVVHAVMKGS